MLRALPVRDGGRLVFVQTAGTAGRDGPPYPYFELLRDQTRTLDAVGAFSPSNMELAIDGGREQARGVWVSGNFYQTLGVAPVIGRTLAASDDQTPGRGGPDGAVAVISRAYWQQRFGGDPGIVGRTVHMRFDFEHAVTIVGVMPSEVMSLETGRPIDIAVLMMVSDRVKLRDRAAMCLFGVARLKPGVRVEQARAESNALFQAYMADVRLPAGVRKRLFDHMELTPASKGLGGLRQQFSQPVTAMMILAGLVLLAACVNVANLMLARATARQKEFAVRLAIGAGRGRLIRQTLTEALVLVGAGAALGIWLAGRGEAALAAFFADGSTKIVLDLSLNGRMLLFTLTVAVLSGLAFGILPALRASRIEPTASLQSASRGIAGSRLSLRLGRALVIAQVALSTVLLAGAGLFIRTLQQLESVDLGFTSEGILTMEVAPERQAAAGTPQWLAAQAEILERVRRIPGVRSTSWSTTSPMSGRDRGAVLDIPGFEPRNEKDKGCPPCSAFASVISTHSAYGWCWDAYSRRAMTLGLPGYCDSERDLRPILFRQRKSDREEGQVRKLSKPRPGVRNRRRGERCEAQQPSREGIPLHLRADAAIGRRYQPGGAGRTLRGRCRHIRGGGEAGGSGCALHRVDQQCFHGGATGGAIAAQRTAGYRAFHRLRRISAVARVHRLVRHSGLRGHAPHQ